MSVVHNQQLQKAILIPVKGEFGGAFHVRSYDLDTTLMWTEYNSVLSSSHTDFRCTVIFLYFVIRWAAGKQKNEHVQAGGDHHSHLCVPVVNRNCSYCSTKRYCSAFTAGEQGDMALSCAHIFCMNS